MPDNLPANRAPALSRAQRNNVINILRRAAKTEIMPRFRGLNAADIATKSGPDDLVTIADTAAEAMITRALHMAFPGALVIGEEAVSADASLLDKIADAPLCFIIDPIDGTWNYARGLSVFGIILAVTRYGKPAFGLIYDPVMDDWVIADDQGPAQMQHPSGVTRDLQASQGGELAGLSGYVPLYLFDHARRQKLASKLPDFGWVGSLRCSAHEYRMLAQGHVDFVLTESLNPWDHAAGVLICQQAGGYVQMLSGEDYTATLRSGHLLAAPDKATWNRLAKAFKFLNDADL
ncbi:Inositol-1-monophosphatase [Sulfitobacter sp. THAF37]|uniref:inositol monophosphatase family protein n=1 Tax=Sulfitobacter sp. THAF37 TaxID=2587855 RepID=UPI001267AD32|nr:inositol monophosphatase [Sulfitobacter sp. THAF37]QFT58743.1 Inositol-1-monophosphatase [Sulfitobacter sp. THAF37]